MQSITIDEAREIIIEEIARIDDTLILEKILKQLGYDEYSVREE